jgi:hypothetical protein
MISAVNKQILLFSAWCFVWWIIDRIIRELPGVSSLEEVGFRIHTLVHNLHNLYEKYQINIKLQDL